MFQLKTEKYDPGFPAQPMGGSPLLDAAWERDAKTFEEIASATGSNQSQDILSVKDALGNDPLAVATYRGASEIIRYLVDDVGLDPGKSANAAMWTPMHLCVYRDWVDVAEYFLDAASCDEAKTSPSQLVTNPDLNGMTPFHVAAEMNRVECVRLFLSRGLPIDPTAPSCVTPIVLACRENNIEVARLLASAGADICRKSTLHDGISHQTPLLFAAQHGWEDDLRRWGAVPGKPQAPIITKLTHDETKVEWIAPAGRSAPVESYELQVRRVHRLLPEAPWITVASGVRERVHTFYTCAEGCSAYSRPRTSEDLDPGCAYNVRVYASSLVGRSAPSEPSDLFMTAPGTPSKPKPPVAVRVTNTSITFEWQLPYGNGAPVEESQVQWKLVHSPYGEWSTVPDTIKVPQVDSDYESLSESSDTDDERDPEKDIVKHTYTLTNLAPGHRYRIRVRARNCVGWSYVSEPSDTVLTRTESGGRRQGFTDNMRTGEERKWAQGTDPHAEARFLSILRVRADAVQRERNEKMWAEEDERGVVEGRAVVVMQTAWRGCSARREFRAYLDAWNASARVLIEYGTEHQFKAQWCAKVMRHVDAARARREAAADDRMRRRNLRLQKKARKEARELKRKLRKLALR